MSKIIFKIITLILFIGIITAGFVVPKKMFNDFINESDNNSPGENVEDGNGSEGDGTEVLEKGFTVYLNTDEHCTCVSKNPIIVKPGENATFDLIFEDNYIFKESDNNAVFENGKLILNNCNVNTNINLTSRQKSVYYDFDYENPPSDKGVVECTKEKGRTLENQFITIKATPSKDNTFLGWSIGGTLLGGGTMISYSSEYSFNLNNDLKLYPNFLVEGFAIIKYNLNGGVLASDGVTDVIFTQFDKSIKPCPNLMAETGVFVRDRHTVLEYTTNKDGSGTAINPGGLAKIPESGILEVWVQWSEWEPEGDFRYEIADGKVTITDYVGNSDVLTIPEKIENLPVTAIKADAILGCDFGTLVLPKTILQIDSGAVKRCPNFTTLYMYDTFTSVPNDFYIECAPVNNLRFNAGRNPSYGPGSESIATRWEYILTRDPSVPIMLLVGGSSSLYGYNSPLLQEKLNNEYYVINCGTNAGGTGMAYIEGLSYFLQPGDIIVDAPEFNNTQNGRLKFYWRTFRATESCYNLYRYIDFAKYELFFSAFSEFNTSSEARGGRGTTTYNKPNTSLTKYHCDLAGDHPYKGAKYGVTDVNKSHLNTEIANNFNEINRICESNGVKLYLSSAPVCMGAETPSDRLISNCNAYYEHAKQVLNFPVISNPADYMFKNTEYYNSSYHITSEAAKDRSLRLFRDLIKQFELEQ